MDRILIFIFSCISKIKISLIDQAKLKFEGRYKVYGYINWYIKNGGQIIIGKNVTFNSNYRSYHVQIYSAVKIMADREDAFVKIGENTRINGSCIHAYKRITIGSNCLIAANCQIFDGSGHDLSFEQVENRINTIGGAKEVIIGNNVWLGINCIVLPGTTIGDGSVVVAGSVLRGEYPGMALIGGNPAKVIKIYDHGK